MRVGSMLSRPAVSILIGIVIGMVSIGLRTAPANAFDDKPAEIPAALRGTWLLRLTSDDGGKTYKSGDGKPLCEVSGDTIQFVRKVEFSDEKPKVKQVTTEKDTTLIDFDNDRHWRITQNGKSITTQMHTREGEKLRETYRIVIRLKE
ncbi:MAG: hypothetical protein HZA46_18830 [Planctomycetales bacterium]|nr:hypothetical protein [Planctomycetales bacterium]